MERCAPVESAIFTGTWERGSEKKSVGGGAFGKAGAKRLPQADGFDYDRITWRYIDRDRNTTIDLLRYWNAASESDPGVIEKSSILDAVNEGVLETPPAFQARRVLDRIHHEELSAEEMQAAIDEALAIDPDSIDVRLSLAEQAGTAETADAQPRGGGGRRGEAGREAGNRDGPGRRLGRGHGGAALPARPVPLCRVLPQLRGFGRGRGGLPSPDRNRFPHARCHSHVVGAPLGPERV